MSLAALPVRAVVGAFFLNSGLSKRNLPEEAVQGLQNMGAAGVPPLKDLDTKTFGKLLPAGEIGIAAALLTPFVPGWLAGSALAAFAGGLVSMYLNTPGMTKEDGIRPSQDGTALAKDSWLLAIGLGLVIDSLANRK
ncbi:MauE/DoxX family redox-associated membrane protein [Nigerium massiliense]|uniref:MauE/DoxX family redox-associated membrane protein n=1 Tax=Nigerium massiliense TaxID=1522317 RepID=UPI000590440A|nr:MauE/DoxX family redox-associated membrane protein [Nigerium massiliense]